jgi:hypothetical protein
MSEPCPACGRIGGNRYHCRHCRERVCCDCLFVKRCCGWLRPGYKPVPRLLPLGRGADRRDR